MTTYEEPPLAGYEGVSGRKRHFNICIIIAGTLCRLAGIPRLITNDKSSFRAVRNNSTVIHLAIHTADIPVSDTARPSDFISFRRWFFKLRPLCSPDGAILTSDGVGQRIRRGTRSRTFHWIFKTANPLAVLRAEVGKSFSVIGVSHSSIAKVDNLSGADNTQYLIIGVRNSERFCRRIQALIVLKKLQNFI